MQQVVDEGGAQIAAEEARKQQIKDNIRRQAAQADSLATAAQEESNRVYKGKQGCSRPSPSNELDARCGWYDLIQLAHIVRKSYKQQRMQQSKR